MIKKIFKFISFLIGVFIIWYSYLHLYGNFHKVDENLYRSAQLYSFNMPYYVKKYNIKTIINLKKKVDKYEKEFVKENNITYFHIPLSDSKEVSIEKMEQLVKIMNNAKKPILVHCFAGADRTSLATALYLYEKGDKNPTRAFNFIPYGHFPWFTSPTKAMDKSFENFKKNQEKN